MRACHQVFREGLRWSLDGPEAEGPGADAMMEGGDRGVCCNCVRCQPGYAFFRGRVLLRRQIISQIRWNELLLLVLAV